MKQFNTKQNEVMEWYDLYSQSIYRFIFVMINDCQQAEDLTQDTFVRAYQHYESFERRANPKTWLFNIAHNVTIDYIRKRKPINMIFEFFSTTRDSTPLPEEIIQIKETSLELYQALKSLKTSYREVILLRKVKGFTIQETSQILGWSESKVKMTLLRALAALEKQLLKEGFEYESITR